MRIPISALKNLSQEYKLSHIIVFAHDEDNKFDNIATYGKTVEQCAEAANFGNKLKNELGWPDSLKTEPNRVIKLKNRVKELEKKCNELEETIEYISSLRHDQI